MLDEYKSTKCGAPVRDNCIAVPSRNNIVTVCGGGVRLLPRERGYVITSWSVCTRVPPARTRVKRDIIYLVIV